MGEEEPKGEGAKETVLNYQALRCTTGGTLACSLHKK